MKKCLMPIICAAAALFLHLKAEETHLTEPAAKGADRLITLKTLALIQAGDGNQFFLKNPSNPVWLQGGKFLAFTDQQQLLLFDQSGKFVRNLQKTGEGPGEWTDTTGLTSTGDKLVIFCYQPQKCLIFGSDFKLVQEIRLDKVLSMVRPLKYSTDTGYFFSTDIDFAKIKTGTTPFKNVLSSFGSNGGLTKHDLSFEYRVYSFVKREKNMVSVAMSPVEPFLYAALAEKNRVLVACRNGYRLELVDLDQKKIVKTLTRQVRKIPWRQAADDKPTEGAPKPEFFNAVSAIVSRGDQFWVLGADIDDRQSVTVDIVAADGRYLDRFRLPLPGLDHPSRLDRRPLAVSGDRIAWIHLDEDDNPLLSIHSFSLQ